LQKDEREYRGEIHALPRLSKSVLFEITDLWSLLSTSQAIKVELISWTRGLGQATQVPRKKKKKKEEMGKGCRMNILQSSTASWMHKKSTLSSKDKRRE
jgi:hypothetical protein